MTITNILLTLVVLIAGGSGIYYFIKKKKEAPQEKDVDVDEKNIYIRENARIC